MMADALDHWNLRLHVRGDASARSLLFLHGFLGSAQDWMPIIEHFKHARIGCLDLPGHGESAAAAPEAFSFAAAIEWLDAAVARLGGRVDLVGYSMGGRLALHYALERPERLRSLVLESASAGIADPAERAARRKKDQTRSEHLRRVGLDNFVGEWYRQPLFESLARRPGLLQQLESRRASGDAAAVAHAVEAFSPGVQPSLWSRLPALEPRLTFVAGERDARYVKVGREVVAQVEGAHLEIVDDAGHNVHLEQPQRFIDILNDHLNRTT